MVSSMEKKNPKDVIAVGTSWQNMVIKFNPEKVSSHMLEISISKNN